jgi:putative tryptophan/tyrosine transport system substrate-binding protein
MRRRAVFPFLVVVFCAVVLCSTKAHAQKNVGILLFSEEERYEEARTGVVNQLKKAGFEEPAVRFTLENGKGSKARIGEIVQKFASAKLDLIITIGTSATIPVAKKIKDTPIVFCMVYDPIEAGIAKNWKSSGNNTTGASSKPPMAKLVSALVEFAPIKRLAVLYTPGEKNSEAQLRALEKIQALFQIKVVPIILTKKEEAAQIVSELGHTVDALYLTGSSVVGAAVPAIVNAANKSGVVTVTHLDDLGEKGALLSIFVDSYYVGRLAGKKAARILQNVKPSSIPIEVGDQLDVVLNRKTAVAGHFHIPPDFMNKVTKTLE